MQISFSKYGRYHQRVPEHSTQREKQQHRNENSPILDQFGPFFPCFEFWIGQVIAEINVSPVHPVYDQGIVAVVHTGESGGSFLEQKILLNLIRKGKISFEYSVIKSELRYGFWTHVSDKSYKGKNY